MIPKTSTDAVVLPASSHQGITSLLPSNSRIAERIRKPAFWRSWFRRPELDVAEHLLRLRRLRGVTQEELAALMGTKQPAIARLEGGRSNPRLDSLVKAAEALDAVVRVQFTPAEELGGGRLGRNWWYPEGTAERHPDLTFNVDITLTIVVAVPQAQDHIATSAQPFASFNAGNPEAWLQVGHAALPVTPAAEMSNDA